VKKVEEEEEEEEEEVSSHVCSNFVFLLFSSFKRATATLRSLIIQYRIKQPTYDDALS